MVDMAVAMEDTALATTARGLLMPRLTMVVDSSVRPVHMVDLPTLLASAPLMLMPTTAMVDMEAMAAMVDTATERGQLMLMPTTATEDMEVMAMAVTVTERGPLMLMPTTAMEDMAAMAAMAATATERGLPMLMPTTAMVDMVVTATAVAMDTAMVVMAMADMAMASKSYLVNGLTSLLLTFHDTHRNQTKIISPLSIMAGTTII